MAQGRQYDERYREGSPMALRLGGLGLIALVILGLGFLAGRASAPKATTAGPATTATAPGASRTENGVPVGYSQTRTGAVSAATNFTRFLTGPLVLHPDGYRAALGTLAAPEAKTKLLGEAETSLATIQNNLQIVTNAARGVQVSIGAYPLAYHVNNYSPTVTEVSVWAVGVIAEDGQLAPSQSWQTVTVDLEWTNGDWKVTADGTTPGPVPALVQSPLQTKDLPQQLRDYSVYDSAPTP
jgi:hypothetical protein